MMLDLGRRAVRLPVFLNRPDAVRADRYDLLHAILRERFKVSFSQLLEEQVVAQPPHRVASAALLAHHAEARAEVSHYAHQGHHNLAPARIVRAHAAEPQAIFLRPVEEG